MKVSALIVSLTCTLVNVSGFQQLPRFIGSKFVSRNGLITSDSNMQLNMGARNRAWAKGDLSDKDIFDDGDDDGDASAKKEKFKLTPEVVFFEGPPSTSELIFPALSIITVIGVVPFASALSRQAWVRYKFTSRRISIQSGIGGKEQTEIIYQDIEEIRYAFRSFGAAGDMVLFLKDGAKVEMRFVPKFKEIYSYVLEKVEDECREKSMKLPVEKTE
mmetsp:Transcript_26159/g.26395  ORF Transcript_26159/g.26395 Transcript_26159/m.26395 type:complete len:217 (-) Transcript_26159:54-704(-)|eukprot:CAMPEP_0182427610 /NCGR_PEP_ID=MMETSP1167-20130531/18914_1 /TAXON_ID=2988 /ORGANISM="Mallomonas Sp, Strain CCMP3275" /LENGTH=216 /DNA_ID=CAMNT_0024609971 /DNA_START=75 /DNA_END=722 /DNA_ORIENTATION=+